MERKQIFSIKKLKIGVASVLIGTGWVIAGGHSAATVHASENTLLTEKRNTEASTLSSEIENKLEKKEETDDSKKDINSSELVDKTTISDKKNKEELVVTEKNEINVIREKENTLEKKEETKKVSSEESTVTELNKKKEEVAPKRSKRSKRELSDGETTDYSGAKISGRLNDGKTQYAVGDQILGSYNLDISSPTKIEEGGYILITASDNEPLDTFEIGSSLRYEKVNNNQYKLYTGELSGGAYANINVSYKLKKFETGKDSNTTIKAELFDKNNTLIKSTNFSNTNTTGTPYVSVDTRNGIRR